MLPHPNKKKVEGICLLCVVWALVGFPLGASCLGAQTVIRALDTKEEKGVVEIRIRVAPNPVYKVMEIGPTEVMVAFKDAVVLPGVGQQRPTTGALLEGVWAARKPGGTVTVLVKLKHPVKELSHVSEPSQETVTLRVVGSLKGPAGPGAAARKGEDEKAVEEKNLAQGPRPVEPPPPVLPPLEWFEALHPGQNRLLRTGPSEGTPDHKMLLAAVRLFEREQWQEAERVLSELMKHYPESPHLDQAGFLRALTFQRSVGKDLPKHYLTILHMYRHAMAAFPRSAFLQDVLVLLADCHLQAGNVPEALAQCRRLSATHKERALSPDFLLIKGRSLAGGSRKEEAAGTYQELERRSPGSAFAVMARLERAKLLFEENAFHRSLAILEQLVAQHPDLPYRFSDVLLTIAQNHYELGRLRKAREAFLSVWNGFPEMPDGDLILTRVADTFRDEGNHDKALRLYDLVIQTYPDSDGGLISEVRVAEALQKIKGTEPETKLLSKEVRGKNAEEIYQGVVEKRGDSHPMAQLAILKLAQYHQRQALHEKAVEALLPILSNYPDTKLKKEIETVLLEAARVILGSKEKAGQAREVIEFFTTLDRIVSFEEAPELVLIAADAYRALDHNARALDLLRRAEAAFPDPQDQPRLLCALGEVLWKLDEVDEGRRTLEQFVTLHPGAEGADEAHLRLGLWYFDEGQYAKAGRFLRLAVRQGSAYARDHGVHFFLSQSLAREGRHEEALIWLERAVALCEEEKGPEGVLADLYHELGDACMELGQVERALSAFEKALAATVVGARDPALFFKAARCKGALGAHEQAQQLLAQVAASDAGFWGQLAQTALRQEELERDLEGRALPPENNGKGQKDQKDSTEEP